MAALRSALALLRGKSGFAAVAQTGITTAFVLVLNVATGILCARLLGADGRGALSALLLTPQLLVFLFQLGLPVALVLNVKNRPDDSAGLLGAALVLAAALGVLASCAGLVLVPRLLAQYDANVLTLAK